MDGVAIGINRSDTSARTDIARSRRFYGPSNRFNVLSPTGLDPAKAAYMSGLRDGIRYLLSVCHGAEDRLEGVLKRHGVQPEGE